ncbi:MAG TPA: maleylpyruvate isomerase N-terminal domain-containing protein [Candidatus Limnocylindria bacterium]|jgi:SHS2 domain-containing protein
MIERGPEQVEALLRELQAARDEFVAALDDVEPSLLTAPGLVGDWSARELIAHLGYWTGHAAEALHQAELDRTADFGEDEHDVDERNAIVARVAAGTDLATVRQREELAFEALVTRLARADPAWLDEKVSYGDTLERVIQDDGPEHYREHTLDLRAWFTGAAEADDGDDGDAEAGDADEGEPDGADADDAGGAD